MISHSNKMALIQGMKLATFPHFSLLFTTFPYLSLLSPTLYHFSPLLATFHHSFQIFPTFSHIFHNFPNSYQLLATFPPLFQTVHHFSPFLPLFPMGSELVFELFLLNDNWLCIFDCLTSPMVTAGKQSIQSPGASNHTTYACRYGVMTDGH